MGAGVPAAVAFFFTSELVHIVIVRTILINVALGALQFDDGTDTWVADR